MYDIMIADNRSKSIPQRLIFSSNEPQYNNTIPKRQANMAAMRILAMGTLYNIFAQIMVNVG